MFEKASRLKLRFKTPVGLVTTEDLWDLPLTNPHGASLDNVAKGLNKQLKESQEESFVTEATHANARIELQFEIVKHVIAVRLAEAKAKEDEALRKSQKEKILDIIAKKKDASLEGLDIPALEKLAKNL